MNAEFSIAQKGHVLRQLIFIGLILNTNLQTFTKRVPLASRYMFICSKLNYSSHSEKLDSHTFCDAIH